VGLKDEALGGDYMQKVFIDNHDFWLNYWSHQVDRIRPLLGTANPRLLDIGCAMGHFLLAAREAGWQVVGVELSKRQADYARNVFNL
jgi:cyclopropane fatty-acyl-phospholipid synthase-like methyltransferase